MLKFASGALAVLCTSRNTARMAFNLRKVRESKNLRLEDIAEQVGVAISTIQRWEKGKIDIPASRFPAIAEAYGVDVRDLIGPSEQSPAPEAAEVIDLWSRIPTTDRSYALKALKGFAEGSGS